MNAYFWCLPNPKDDLAVNEDDSVQPSIDLNKNDSAAQATTPINNSTPALNTLAQVTEPVL